MKFIFTFIILIQFHLAVYSQLFPGLQGDDLVTAIQSDFTPNSLLNETQVKDTLYAVIFLENDSVRCIYSDLPRFLPEAVDPSQFLFGTGNETESINLEHGWPQAKGAGDGSNGSVDMHHLYPSRTKINSDRANFPFININDHVTDIWYYLSSEMSSVPVNNIDAYSEFVNGSFEPREEVKGDIARAMFYFWTIYRDDAVEADPDFFELQREYLCQWHVGDPVDDFENLRNQRIAVYQDGKLNPFIIDCTLAERAYCPGIEECITVGEERLHNGSSEIKYDALGQQFLISSEQFQRWDIRVVNVLGQVIVAKTIIGNEWISIAEFNTGFYVILAKSDRRKTHLALFKL